jgi:hypothetical protein
MRIKLFILFLLHGFAAIGQDTINASHLYLLYGTEKDTADGFISYAFYDPNAYLDRTIYQDGKKFTGITKAEHQHVADVYGHPATFIAEVRDGHVWKINAYNPLGQRFFSFLAYPDSSILAIDTTWLPFGFNNSDKPEVESVNIIFEKNNKRYGSYKRIIENEIEITYGVFKPVSEEPEFLLIDIGIAERRINTITGQITLDTIIYSDDPGLAAYREYHEYDSSGNHKYRRETYYTDNHNEISTTDFYNWGDTLQMKWFKTGPRYDSLNKRFYYKQLQYVAMKNGTIREWYENGQLKSEQLTLENGEIEIKRWDKKGQLLKEKKEP